MQNPKPKPNMTLAEYKELQKKPAGGSWRGRVATPTDRDGIRFPSKIQAAVWSLLRIPATQGSSRLIVREPILDLWSLSVAGVPARYRPDFMTITTAKFVPGSFLVEFHEAKGSRAAESRDWKLRAAAAMKEYPQFPFYVWRTVGKSPRRMTLVEALQS